MDRFLSLYASVADNHVSAIIVLFVSLESSLNLEYSLRSSGVNPTLDYAIAATRAS